MSVKDDLLKRSQSKCELCTSEENLNVYEVSPSDGTSNRCILICSTCKEQIEDDSKMNPNHFRCLNDSMWSEVPAVQVMAYRLLNQLKSEGWPQDLLDMLFLEDDVKSWAEEGMSSEEAIKHVDSNGVVLQAGDTVTIIKDLEVKGAGFTAKRGTAVRNISLTDNPEHIEGRVNGVKIVILTKFLKKS